MPWTWPQFRDALFHRGPSYNAPARAAAPQFAAVGETPAQQGVQTGYTYIWGPFADHGTAFRFSEFVTREIDPATVMYWDDALSQPNAKPLDPVQELLNWREATARWINITPKET